MSDASWTDFATLARHGGSAVHSLTPLEHKWLKSEGLVYVCWVLAYSLVVARVFAIPDCCALRLMPLGHISAPLQDMAAVPFTVLTALGHKGFAFKLLAGWPMNQRRGQASRFPNLGVAICEAFINFLTLGQQSAKLSQVSEPWGHNL